MWRRVLLVLLMAGIGAERVRRENLRIREPYGSVATVARLGRKTDRGRFSHFHVSGHTISFADFRSSIQFQTGTLPIFPGEIHAD